MASILGRIARPTFPTAIGSEPREPNYDRKDHWQLCMRGHSASNIMPVVASNRIGTETFAKSEITFYGSSFITDNKGQKIAEMDRTSQGVIVMPLFDTPHDQGAMDLLSALFPDRNIIGVKSREILLGGGNIHCITQQLPLGATR